MTSPETRKIVKHIDSGVEKIRRRININTFIFLITLVLAGISVYRIKDISKKQLLSQESIAENTKSVAGIKASQDLYRQQYLDYIKDMIDAMNKLQEDNPGLKVPKAPVPRPISGKVSESDLRREPQPGPSQTPRVIEKTKVITKRIKPKHSPTPKPFFQWFKSTR